MKACDVKNRILIIIFIIAAVIFTTPLCRIPYKASAADISDNSVIVLSGSIDGKKVSVDATLMENTGLHSLTVEISYDTNAMTLVNVVKGTALSSLNYMTTDVTTEKGYGITPFIINWLDAELNNDATTGRLFTMEFSVKDNVSDGKYTVTLKTDVQPNTYVIDGQVKTKNVLINGVQVKIKGDVPQSVIPEKNEKSNILLWISIGVAGVVVAILIVAIVIKIKGKKAWTKIE